MSTSKSDPGEPPPEEHIYQQAGDRSTQIGKVMGDLRITYAIPVILVIAVVFIAFVEFSGVNAPALMGWIAPSPTVTLTSTLTPVPTLTAIPTATLSLTRVPLQSSPVPCQTCGQVIFAVATPVETKQIKPATMLKLRQFALDTAVSSFSFSGNMYDTDIYKMDWMRVHGCLPEVEPFLPNIKTALQNFARAHGHDDLLPYIQTEEQIQTLAMERPEIANELVPTEAEWQDMSATEYEAMSQWQLNCIGIPWPAWNVTIENTSNQDQLITRILYRTYETDYVMGGGAGLLSPEVAYVHQIDWIKGDQEVELVPPFVIPANSSGSFELQLTTAYPDFGRVWNMQIFFIIDEERGAVSTETFSLIMSGLAAPGGGFK